MTLRTSRIVLLMLALFDCAIAQEATPSAAPAVTMLTPGVFCASWDNGLSLTGHIFDKDRSRVVAEDNKLIHVSLMDSGAGLLIMPITVEKNSEKPVRCYRYAISESVGCDKSRKLMSIEPLKKDETAQKMVSENNMVIAACAEEHNPDRFNREESFPIVELGALKPTE